MASKRSSGESSNTGLIVALVFFVLATIGLGVGTYMGYSGKADAEKATKSANDAKTTAEKASRDEKAKRLAVVIATGAEQGTDRQDFNGLRTEFASSMQAQVNNLRRLQPRWDVATQGDRPPKTYEALIDELTRATQQADTLRKAKEAELEEAKRTAAESITELQARLKSTQDNLAKAQKDVLAAQNVKSENFTQDQGKIDQLSKENEQLKLDKINQEVELSNKIKLMQSKLDEIQKSRGEFGARVGPVLEKLEQVKAQRPEVRELGELTDMLKRQFERVQSLANDTPKGEVVSVDRANGSMVYINLGSADYVQPQLTFSVLPAGSTGKAAAGRERKAAIEVVEVQGPHLSKAKVIDSVNLVRDPLMRGDLLFNPVWSSSQRLHVAIAGIIDLNGDGIDDTPDLVKALARQGVEVDAFLDLRSRSVVGPGITEKTTYLILGESPVPPQVIDETNPLVAATQDVLGKIADLKNKARDLGVEPVQYRRFLALIGYRLPKQLQPADYSQSSYLRGVGGTPAKPDGDKDKDRIPK